MPALKRDLPGGPCWRRYPFDGYGQKEDGSAFEEFNRHWALLAAS